MRHKARLEMERREGEKGNTMRMEGAEQSALAGECWRPEATVPKVRRCPSYPGGQGGNLEVRMQFRFNEYLLVTCCVPGTVLGAEATEPNEPVSCLLGLTFWRRTIHPTKRHNAGRALGHTSGCRTRSREERLLGEGGV